MKKTKLLFYVFLVLCLLLLASCGKKKPEDKIKITPGELEMNLSMGNEYVISFQVENMEYEVSFSGFDKKIISVDEEGYIKPLKEGNTVVTVTICSLTDDTEYSYDVAISVKDERVYTVSYEVNVDGMKIDADSVKHGATLVFKEAPSIEGYKFLGYSKVKDSNQYITKLDNIREDVMVYANYKKIIPVVSFFVNGQELESERKTLSYGDMINPNDVSVQDSGFIGWISNQDLPQIITGQVKIVDDTKFIAVFSKSSYSVTYDLAGGDWEKTYYTIEELASDYVKDYNANGGSASNASYLDTAHLDSGDFAKAFSTSAMKTKWMWLYKALWEEAGKKDSLNPEKVDLTSYEAKSFYISEICGFLTKSQHTDSNFGTTSVDYSQIEKQMEVIQLGPTKSIVKGADSYKPGKAFEFIEPLRTGYEFVGWKVGGKLIDSMDSSFVGDITLVAEWKQAVLPSQIDFMNIPNDGIKLYDNLKLEWIVGPEAAYNKDVYFQALTPEIFTIDDKGNISTVSKGTGKIKVKFAANSDFEEIVSIDVVAGDYFDISYETESYTTVGKSIILNSAYYDINGNKKDVTWESLTPDIATVDGKGKVTAIATGLAKIRSKYDNDHYIDFVVTVLEDNLSDELNFVLENHNSNALTVYNLGIGDGNPAYYYDLVGSVSDILFDPLKIDRTYYDKLASGTKNYGTMTSVEFICVHYTGNMAKGADADNNCDYFNNLEYQASIHFVTGRSNLYTSYNEDEYYAFAGLNEKYAGWHASTGQNKVIWDKAGVQYVEGDPEVPEISISKNNKYTINGKETIISIPAVPSGYTLNGNDLVVGGKHYSAINALGLVAKVENGEYYIARTYWGSQRSPQAICTYGGNTNSIGIESCVDIGSDLMHTWHVTAQLVAKLLLDNDLSFDRVVGHHFFSGKDCPQPLLENDLQLWNEFLDMVKAEYALLTTYKDVKITAKAIDDEGLLSDKGLLKQDANSHIVTYEVTIEKNGVKQTITLATAVESFYCYEGTRQYLSLQNLGYDIQ